MVNAMGLPNPGAEAAARALGRTTPRGPRVASIADQDLPDVLETHALVEPFVEAVELNASCPNVAWGRDRDNETHLAHLVRELVLVGRARCSSSSRRSAPRWSARWCSRSPRSRSRRAPTH